jgi:hypothetical protein
VESWEGRQMTKTGDRPEPAVQQIRWWPLQLDGSHRQRFWSWSFYDGTINQWSLPENHFDAAIFLLQVLNYFSFIKTSSMFLIWTLRRSILFYGPIATNKSLSCSNTCICIDESYTWTGAVYTHNECKKLTSLKLVLRTTITTPVKPQISKLWRL